MKFRHSKLAKRQRMATWKQAMINDDKALGRWLRSNCVRGACFIDGAETIGEACCLVHDYWFNFWHEAEQVCPSVDARINALPYLSPLT